MTPDHVIDDILALDMATLFDWRDGTARPLDPVTHRAAVLKADDSAQTLTVYDGTTLRAYLRLFPQSDGIWFVTGLVVSPDVRGPAVARRLMRKLIVLIAQHQITKLRSNVFRGNAPSIRLHKALGFTVTRQNDVGLEMTLATDRLVARFARL